MQSRATEMLRITKGGSHELNDVYCTDDWVTKKKKENIYIDIRVNFTSSETSVVNFSLDSHEIKHKKKR